jgi:methionyl-tRNA formyltransferase
MPLKIIFAGTPEFAIPTLQALITSKHSICAVYTKPDRPAGRGLKLTSSAVKDFAIANKIQVLQPETLKDFAIQKIMHDFEADILVDVAYGLFLPKEVLTMFKYGCINVHPSLLPRWRGAAPIQRTLLAGDAVTGVTIMQVDEGWDTGDILTQIKVDIKQDDTSASLSEVLANLGAELLLTTLDKIEANEVQPQVQDEKLSCYAKKITKEEANLDWSLTAMQLERVIRAFNPWPVAFTAISDQTIRIWRAIAEEEILDSTKRAFGTIVKIDKNGIYVATGCGILRILELQLPGGKRLPVNAILNAKHELFAIGKKFHG